MSKSKITRIKATQVIVPPRPGSINSVDILEEDRTFAKKFLTGDAWSDFALQPKWILEIELANGLVGIGETYRNAPRELLFKEMELLKGKDILNLNWRRLPIRNQRMYEAFETAILDLVGQFLGVPVHQLLGGAYRNEIECMGWTGRRTSEEAADKAFEAMQKGHKAFKFKCADDDQISLWIDAIKRKCGYGIKILLDPNQRWTDVDTTMKLMKGVDTELMLGLEDPILHADIDGFLFLKRHLGLPVYRHISLPYHQDMRDIIPMIKADAADGYNFNGSGFNSVLLAEIANLEGKSCWRGSEVDLGISETMGLHIAAASINCILPSDIFGELVREDDLIEDGIVFVKGAAQVPKGIGLGVTLDQMALRKYSCAEMITSK
jgi:muconate cycloisomerase